MVPPTPTLSRRLVKAAQAEAAELARHRAKLLSARGRLQDELDRIEQAIDDVSERQALLERLTGNDASELMEVEQQPAEPIPAYEPDEGAENETTLRGPDIRITAVQVALTLPNRPEALHYRDWYQAVIDAGYHVAGKNPLAVFLTQLSRSPVVTKGTQSGVYGIDRAAARRIRNQLTDLQRELRDVAASTGGDRDALRQRRHSLTVEIGRTERALEEVEAVFGTDSDAIV